MRFVLCRATVAEQRRVLPGDGLIPHPSACITHALTIAASPDRVWPWLAQLGAGRGGWYSYDRIDNGAVPSARRIIAGLQRVAVGDVLPALPGARDAFIVAEVVPARTLVLSVPVPAPDGTAVVGAGLLSRPYRVSWAFVLKAVTQGRTRLIVRGRVGDLAILPNDARAILAPIRLGFLASILPLRLIVLLARPGHLAMERKMLLGIKERAEGARFFSD